PAEAPPPRLVIPRIEGQFTSARLRAERAEDPTAFDWDYAGKVLLIRGTYATGGGGAVILSDEGGEGTAISCLLQSPAPTLQPGQPVTVRGRYVAGLRLSQCEVLDTSCPADDQYKGKEVQITGLVDKGTSPEDVGRFPTITLVPPTTDCPVTVRGFFRAAKAENVGRLKAGQPVVVRGRCSGRSFRVVRLDNCVVVPPTDPPDPNAIAVPAARFFADYEPELLVMDRPGPNAEPVAVSAERLVAAFQNDPRAAPAAYKFKRLQVSGTVISRNPTTNTLVFEAGTGDRLQVVAAFTPSRFRAVRANDTDLTVRGTCSGLRGTFIRLENAEVFDPDADNP